MYEKMIAKLKARLQKNEELTRILQQEIVKIETKKIIAELKKQHKSYLIIKHSIDAMNDSIENTSDVDILNENIDIINPQKESFNNNCDMVIVVEIYTYSEDNYESDHNIYTITKERYKKLKCERFHFLEEPQS